MVFRDPSPELGYLILPDMKWDLVTLSSLYLVAISFNRSIRSIRDLSKAHLPMLYSIRREGARAVQARWGLAPGSLRMFIHYQPSYCASAVLSGGGWINRAYVLSADHFHVHIVNTNYVGLPGMSAGQAHLLDDVISLVSISYATVYALI